jgi:hypothetical protein
VAALALALVALVVVAVGGALVLAVGVAGLLFCGVRSQPGSSNKAPATISAAVDNGFMIS